MPESSPSTSIPGLSSPNLLGAGPLSGQASGALWGRAAELEQLDGIFARAVQYQAPQLITVVGTQGVGKTRLVAEWLRRLLERQSAGTAGRPRVYRGRGQKGAGSYSLVSRLLRDRFAIGESDDEARRIERVRTQLTDVFADRRMTEVLHFLGRFLDLRSDQNAFLRAVSSSFGGGGFGGLGDETRHEDAIARTVLRRFLELDAERSPLVLAFDDLHQGDDDSLTLLGELAQGLGGSPVVLIAAARPELFVRRPAWGEGNLDHTRIDLGPLERADGEKLLRSLLAKAEPLPAALVEDVCELTGGNPFFLEEVVRVFCSNGTVTAAPGGDKWRIDANKAAQIELPMTVEEAIEARIAALSPLERSLLEKAATLGSVFWLGALVVLQRSNEGEAGDQAAQKFAFEERARIEAALEELVERDYLLRMPDSSVPGEVEFIFKHNLEHDLIQKQLPPARARRYHRTAAEWLETRMPPVGEQSGEQLELQASLYEKGGNAPRAAAAYLAAGDKARARFAAEAAIELYERGLALYDPDDALQRIDPLHNYGDVLQRCGRTAEAHAAFRAMLRAAWQLDHPAKAGAAHGRLARLHRAQGEYARAEEHLVEALALFRAAADSRGVAAVEDDLGRVAFLRGDFPAALERHGRALDLRRALGHKRSLALSLHNLALVHQAAGAPAEALQRFTEALQLRREIGDRQGVAESLSAVAAAWRDRGDPERALEVLTEALGLSREIGDRLEQARVLTRMGEILIRLARDREAAAELAQASQLAQGFGDRLLESEAARLLAEVHLQLGDLRAARDEARRALELAEKVGSRPSQGIAHRVLGSVIARGGITDEDKAEADRHFTRAIEILGEVGAELELGHTFQSYSHVLAERGDSDGSQTFAERAGEITEKIGPRLAPKLDGSR
ncbi:MAG TPA: tetratricopeptide repeat protein [Polyangia bacterium]